MFFRCSGSSRHRPLAGVERREAACAESCQMVEFRLDEGAVIPPHRHPHEQIGMVLSGRMVLRVGEETADLRAGDGYAVPPGVEHEVKVLEDSLVIDVFSPPRDDYRD